MISTIPLAISMILGPQIITAILLIPSNNRVVVSLAYILAVAFATFTGILGFHFLSEYVNIKSLENVPPNIIKHIEIGICTILIGLSIKTFLKRKTSKEPSWIKSLETISSFGAVKLGLFLIYIMPGDFLSMLVIALHWSDHIVNFYDIIGFTILISFLVSIPLISYLLFKRSFVKYIPNIQQWLNTNSWMLSIVCYLMFVFIIINSL